MADDDLVGLFVLLDFLMGNSIDQVTRGHRLASTAVAEALIRSVLLRHGYDGAVRLPAPRDRTYANP